MSRTINGKDIKQIMQELAADFPENKLEQRDYDHVYYIGVDTYRDRMDEIVGVEHYTETYDNVEIVRAGNTYAAKTICRFTLLDDNFEPIFTKVSSGGSTIAFPKVPKLDENGNEIKDQNGKTIQEPGLTTNSLPNDFDSACQDAFKRICKKQFNMGKAQLNKKSMKQEIQIKILAIKEYNGNYFGDILCEGKKIKLAVFKNSVSAFLGMFNNNVPTVNTECTIYGKIGKDNKGNEQIIFNKPGRVITNKQESNNQAQAPVQSEQKPKEQPQQTTSSTESQKNTSPVPVQDTKTVNLKTVSDIKEVASYPGSYQVMVKEDTEEHKMIFLEEMIKKLDTEKWTMFKESAAKRSTEFTADVVVKNNVYYFSQFTA